MNLRQLDSNGETYHSGHHISSISTPNFAIYSSFLGNIGQDLDHGHLGGEDVHIVEEDSDVYRPGDATYNLSVPEN